MAEVEPPKGSLEGGAIYDDDKFFAGYAKLREDPLNYNDMFEQPVMRRLIGNVSGKNALDVGCGAGGMCRWLADNGAARVVGVDPSAHMLEEARIATAGMGVRYFQLGAESLQELPEELLPLDLVVSSLALHYVGNWNAFVESVHAVIAPGGRLVFSQEHPIYTARATLEPRWAVDEGGRKDAFLLDHYAKEGRREVEWLGTRIVKHHRRTDTILNGLVNAGFSIDSILEPAPSDDVIASYERTRQELHRPAYLIVAATRK